MSTDEKLPDGGGSRAQRLPVPRAAEREAAAKKKRSLVFHISRAMAWLIGGVLALVIVLVGGFAWYSTTEDFQQSRGQGDRLGAGGRDRRTRRSARRQLQPVASGDRGGRTGDSRAGGAGRSAVSFRGQDPGAASRFRASSRTRRARDCRRMWA